MCRMMFGLREIRNSIESLPPEVRTEAPASFAIVSVPSGYEICADGGFKPMPMMIEHDPQPPLHLDERIVEATPAETAEEARIIDNLKSQIDELARKTGIAVDV